MTHRTYKLLESNIYHINKEAFILGFNEFEWVKDNLFILSEWNSEKCKDTKHSTQRQLEATEKASLYITKKKHKNNIYLKLSKTRSNLKTINKYWNTLSQPYRQRSMAKVEYDSVYNMCLYVENICVDDAVDTYISVQTSAMFLFNAKIRMLISKPSKS